MGVCLSQELVERYITEDCSVDERRAVETHLAQCESCRQRTGFTRLDMGASKQSDATVAYQDATDAGSDQTRVLQDEDPTKTISQAPGAPSVRQDFAQSLESMIEGYKIVEALPRGGQAMVYKAVHTATKTNVAIKVLLPALLASERARYYFEREAELIATLDHPNIISIRDSGIIHGQYYFVMQYVEGQPLDRYVLSEELSFREQVVLFNKICTAITYAHQQGIIHRDLKFGNILVDKRGEPHILDFGLAKAVGLDEQASDKAVATMTGQLAGSLSTMSPEQAAGQPHLIDVRTDVYSLGVILYRMLTGQYPYEVAGSTLEVLQNVQKAEPDVPRKIIRKFDSDVEAILLTALAKERDQRYQSAAELKSDIENWLDGRPIRVRSISTMYLLRKIIARHRYTSAVAALLLLIIIGFAYFSYDWYKTGVKAQKDLKVIADELAAKADMVPTLLRRLVFSNFIDMWHAGLIQDAKFRALRVLADGSKEQKAAWFLLNPKSLTQKEPEFRQSLSDDYTGFVDYIVGEHHLKAGNHKEAAQAYRDSQAAIQQSRQNKLKVDTWLEECVKTRLYELSGADMPIDENEESEAGN